MVLLALQLLILWCGLLSLVPILVEAQTDCSGSAVNPVSTVANAISVSVPCYDPNCVATYTCASGYSGSPTTTCNYLSSIGGYGWDDIVGACTCMCFDDHYSCNLGTILVLVRIKFYNNQF